MVESLAFIGLIVPGVVIMFGIGALIAADAIAFSAAMAWAVAGAVTGDGVSFWLGRHYQSQLRELWPFRRYPQTLDRGVVFFDKYGGKSVAFGRFFGPVRAVIPLVAGMLGMSVGRYLIANTLSALVWAPAYLLPGMLFGASLKLASEVAFRLVFLIILLAALGWFSIWFIKSVFLLLHPHARSLVRFILEWSEVHPRIGKIAAALADPNHPEGKWLSVLATLLIFTMGLFGLILGTVLEGTMLAEVNYRVLQGLQSLRTPWTDHLMVFISSLTDKSVMYILILNLIVLLLMHGHRRTVLYWLAAAAFAMLATPLLGYGLQIASPPVYAHSASPYSFPSGHTLNATVLFGFLSVMIARALDTRSRWIPYSLVGLVILLVAISKLYLGVNWLSDILGSITLGLAWVAILGIAYHSHARVESHWFGLAVTAFFTLLFAVTVQSVLFHDRQFQQYNPIMPERPLAQAQWLQDGWRDLPQVRSDSQQKGEHPLNLQFAGSPEWLASKLLMADWKPASMLGWDNLLKMLTPSIPLHRLPVLPQIHDGKQEAHAFTKRIDEDQRLILRIWPTQFRLSPEQQLLWLGNVSIQNKSIVASMVAFARTGADFQSAFHKLLNDLKSTMPSHLHRKNGLLIILQHPSEIPARF